jgi:alcohol dehydrogenase
MLAVHLEKGRVTVRRRPWPARRPGYALIRLITAGVCNTDLELQRGYYNFRGTPGHEFVGEVVDSGEQALLGRRVVGEINLACGKCEWCARGLGRHCPRRTTLGIAGWPGVFSEYFTLPDANLHLVPDNVTNEQAVFTEPTAAACEILDQVRIPRGAPVAVLGDGKLGLLVAQVLKARGLDVRVYGKHKEKLRIAAEAGAAVELVPAKLPQAAYDWVVEATGSAAGLAQAVGMTRPRGAVILKSTIHGKPPVDTAPVVVSEITLVGSRCGRFEPALDLLRKRKVRVDEMISARFPLADAPRAFRLAARRGVLKVLLDAEA